MFVLTACTGSEEVVTQDNGVQAVSLTASTQSASMTRAADGLYTASTGFNGGETVRVFMKSIQKGLEAKDFTVGAADAENGYRSVLTPAADDLFYPTGNEGTVAIYSVYPATSSTTHYVTYDQVTEARYKASDLMYARGEVALADKASQQSLTFGHQLVKLRLVLTKGPGLANVDYVVLKNVRRQATVTVDEHALTLSDLTTATADDPVGEYDILVTGDITCDPVDSQGDNILVSGPITDTEPHTCCVVFPAQAWDNQEILKIVTDDRQAASFLLTKSDWIPGSEYVMTINVDAVVLGTTSFITDWTPQGDIVSRPLDNFYVAPITDQAYTGSALEPAVVVTYNSTTPLTPGTDYKVEYSNNTEPGTATVTIIGINQYTGKTATAHFNIVAP